MQFRNQYGDAKVSPTVCCHDEHLCQLQYAEECDLNVIAKRYGLTDGALLPQAPTPQYFGDFSEGFDLRTALDRVRDANERFSQLPAAMRARFENDPAKLWQFVQDERNWEEAATLGLLQRAPAAKPPEPEKPAA